MNLVHLNTNNDFFSILPIQTLDPSPNQDDHSKHVQDKILEEEIRRQQVNSQVIFRPRP